MSISQDLMRKRIGYDSVPPGSKDPDTEIDKMNSRLKQMGGLAQQNRMIVDKKRSLNKALLYSYQSAFVKKIDTLSTIPPVRALINPNKLKQDYDDKIISIGYEHNFKPGDVFEWVNTDTHWLIYLQELTELAYFRGNIRKCSYEISWEDENRVRHKVYAAIRGPVETTINSFQKHGISVDTPNHSLNFLIPQNEDTLKYFVRYAKFILKGQCWRIEAVDSFSMPGIIEINAIEYFVNDFEDDMTQEIVGGLIVDPINPNPPGNQILGETFIKPKTHYTYTCLAEGEWRLQDGVPVDLSVDENNKATIMWKNTVSGQFILYCGNCEKTIVIESLF